MKLIHIIKGCVLSIWIWKFLITYGRHPFEFDISFYPDYETPTWWLTLPLRHRK
jgi:hypothetical protein